MSDPLPKSWTASQAYTMATVCLILGILVGYLLNSPKPTALNTPVTAVAPQPASGGMAGGMPTASDMKRMADKQVAPLLAELQKNPSDPALLEKIGHSYLAAQQYLDARQYLEKSAGVKPNVDTLNELAFVDYSMGDTDKAIETLNRALKIDPKNPQVLFNLGMFEWHGRSDPKAAIAAWERFVKANPNSPKRAEAEHMIAQAKQHLNIAPGTKTDKPAL